MNRILSFCYVLLYRLKRLALLNEVIILRLFLITSCVFGVSILALGIDLLLLDSMDKWIMSVTSTDYVNNMHKVLGVYIKCIMVMLVCIFGAGGLFLFYVAKTVILDYIFKRESIFNNTELGQDKSLKDLLKSTYKMFKEEMNSVYVGEGLIKYESYLLSLVYKEKKIVKHRKKI